MQNKPFKWQEAEAALARVYIRKTPTSQQNQQQKDIQTEAVGWGLADNIIAERQTFSLTENKQRIFLYGLVAVSVFIIVTEVANAAQRGVYVMRMSGQRLRGSCSVSDFVTDLAISLNK